LNRFKFRLTLVLGDATLESVQAFSIERLNRFNRAGMRKELEMTALAGATYLAPARHHGERTGGIAAALSGQIRRHQERRAIARLGRLSPRLIRDMGFDPAAVYGALEGTWDEVPGDRWRGLAD
jgi:hypothetical protein